MWWCQKFAWSMGVGENGQEKSNLKYFHKYLIQMK